MEQQTMADTFSVTNNVEVLVNGSSQGSYDANGKTLGQFASERAKYAGIRTFNVYVDGKKATTDDSGKSLNGISRIEIVAKDSRGRTAIRSLRFLFSA
jgi:hypothetical protein